MHADIEADIKQAEEKQALTLAAIQDIERRILAALTIWEFYRDKLILRLVSDLKEPLALVDDLAWQAYRPARDLAISSSAVAAVDVREPPLVFPNGRWGPFARSRHTAYELDEVTGLAKAIDGFDKWTRAVPVPVVGIPWYQLAHLPDAVFIGHEVGHLVFDDFGLEAPLGSVIQAALVDATAERRTAWSVRWLSETFADVYGVLTTGSAYVAVLLDLIAGDPQTIADEKQPDDSRSGSPWSDYPTTALRARLVCETLRQLPTDLANAAVFKDRALALETTWITAQPGNAMAAYVNDIELVVRATLTTPLTSFRRGPAGPDLSLVEVLPFTAKMEVDARRDGRDALAMKALVASDIRVLFAGVGHAFIEDPAKFVTRDVHGRFLDRMKEFRTQGKRGVAVPGFVNASTSDRRRAIANAINAALGRREHVQG
jgi:hypothetical protein